jgi:predicted aldo/keto reductase-like oxidoreductase
MVTEMGGGGIELVRMSMDDAVAMVHHCLDLGINWFEVGRGYRGSEKKLGQALSTVGDRDRIIIASKTRMRDVEKAARDIGYSLDNLRTDCIDIYQFHEVNNDRELEEILAPGGAYEAVDRARAEGKIRFIGISCHNLDTAKKAIETGRFDTLQIAFNIIETEAADEVFKMAEDLDIGIMIMKVLGGGILRRADLCFRFMQQYSDQYANIAPLVGFAYKKEADEVAELYRDRQLLSDEDWKEIEKIRNDIGKKFCHRCEYCMPCDQGVNIPMVMNYRIGRGIWPQDMNIKVFTEPMVTVENCIDCEECVEKCPYDLPIPELIREYRDDFDELVKKSQEGAGGG